MQSKLVTIKRVSPVHSDDRGEIFDLIEQTTGHVGLITSKAGSIRGKHYHHESMQYNYILDGELELIVSNKDGSEEERHNICAGDYIEIPVGIVHTLVAKTDSLFLDANTLSRTGDGYEKDTVRVDFEIK